jgi:CDP-diacylglycerol--glycerol-3-phosphate 3-phosphatidyltransferase
VNLPNALTLLRIFFVPLLVAVLVEQNRVVELAGFAAPTEFLALFLFLAAAATDLLDGYLARKWRQITTVGTLLDPIADKLLISAALISLVQTGHIKAWLAILLIGREFAVSGLRSIAAASGFTIQASDLGKTKMAAQVLAIALMILSIRWPALRLPANLALGAVVFFSLASALSYFRKFWSKIDAETKLSRKQQLAEAKARGESAKAAPGVNR